MRPRATTDRLSAAARAGFTLIELLAVLIIISILAFFLVTSVGGAKKIVEAGLTETNLGQMSTLIRAFSDEYGDFPPSSFTPAQGTPPNSTNLGSECLYLAICAEGQEGVGTLDENLSNTDNDKTAKRIEGFETLTLFELMDGWGNPIAYFHNRDYGREDTYTTIDGVTGEIVESQVRAVMNEKTKRYHEPRGFQLISAGLDGRFGEYEGENDDIYNFKAD